MNFQHNMMLCGNQFLVTQRRKEMQGGGSVVLNTRLFLTGSRTIFIVQGDSIRAKVTRLRLGRGSMLCK